MFILRCIKKQTNSRFLTRVWLSISSKASKMSMENIEVSRVMMPDDANIAGNVHGGTILKMIEEAGVIIATRHCNEANGYTGNPCLAALARVERTDFIQPMFIGEVAKVHAELTYAAEHSLEVTAYVWAENLITGAKRLTNHANLWYVAIRQSEGSHIGTVPPINGLTDDQIKEGERRYLRQKQSRMERKEIDESNDLYNLRPQNMLTVAGNEEIPLHSVPYSQSTLIMMLNPSDCNQYKYGQGGPTMKSMDTVAGITAFRHCRTNVVTASVEAVDFRKPVQLGNVMTFTGRVVFTSNRSMEIEVLVDAEDVRNGECFRCVTALFTFVSLDDKRKTLPVPQLVVRTEDEKSRSEEGRMRYERIKIERQKRAAEKKQKTEA